MKFIKALLKFIKDLDLTSLILTALKSVLPGLAGFFAGLLGRPILQAGEDVVDHQIDIIIKVDDVEQAVVAVEVHHDQTKLEEAIGSPTAGQPAEYRDGVETRKGRDH